MLLLGFFLGLSFAIVLFAALFGRAIVLRTACVRAILQAVYLVYLYRKMILCLLQKNSVIVNIFPYNLRVVAVEQW